MPVTPDSKTYFVVSSEDEMMKYIKLCVNALEQIASSHDYGCSQFSCSCSKSIADDVLKAYPLHFYPTHP